MLFFHHENYFLFISLLDIIFTSDSARKSEFAAGYRREVAVCETSAPTLLI